MSTTNIVRQTSHPFLAGDTSRVILPEHASPSITVHSGGEISYEQSEHRISHIVMVQLVMGELSKHLGCRFEPYRVIFQGGMSVDGDHGRHLAHLSSFKDDRFQQILQNIKNEEELREKDEDFLAARNIDTPTRYGLVQVVLDKENFEEFLSSNISPTKLENCLTRTYFECFLNTTDSSPATANQFDSVVERHIRPIALDLLNQVNIEKLSPEEGALQLIRNLGEFCNTALPILRRRIDDLGELEIQLISLRSLPTNSIAKAKIFVQTTQDLLKTKASLTKSEKGVPGISSDKMQILHPDWQIFQKIAKLNGESEEFFEEFQDLESELDKEYDFKDILKDIKARFEGYITEAGYQYQAASCADQKAIHELRTLIFGNSSKDSPSPKRMYQACLEIIKPYYNNQKFAQQQYSPRVVLNSMSETPAKHSPGFSTESPSVSSQLSPVKPNFIPKRLFQSPVKPNFPQMALFQSPVTIPPKGFFESPLKFTKKRTVEDYQDRFSKRQHMDDTSSDIEFGPLFSEDEKVEFDQD